MYDLLIRNGMVIDGTSRAGFTADVAVSEGRIAEIAAIPAEAAALRTVDATGMAVAPGFIDIHTHADIALLARPEHLPKVMQGVTTEVFTNCGLGFAPISDAGMEIQRQYIAGLFGDDGAARNSAGRPRCDWAWRTAADFLMRFEQQGIGANIAYLIPHGAVRVSAMGMEERPASAVELRRMLSMTEEAMEQGAWGISTGVWYAPMRAAEREELTTLFRAAGLFATHQRDYGERLFEATEESLRIAEEAGVPVQISHLQMNGAANRGRAGALLTLLDQARSRGIDVTCDTYPYTAGSTFIQSLLPSWAVDGGPEAILRRLAHDGDRLRIVNALALLPSPGDSDHWRRYALAGAVSAQNRGLEGLNFEDAAAARGMGVPDWICAVLQEDELRACYVHHGAHEENVREILAWPGQMVGSDGLHLPGKTHPRLHGTFPRVLGRYVREERVISLEQAVYKMTGAPAARLGLQKRGTLTVGSAADIAVFDPLTITDTATFEDPLRYPTGIPYVFVNGVAAKWADAPTGALSGEVLRKR